MGVKNKTVLIVDDDQDHRILVSKILSNLGIHVLEAETLEEAYSQVSKYYPHLIILDMKLGANASGFDFLDFRENDMHLLNYHLLLRTKVMWL